MGVPEVEGGRYREPKRWRSDGNCTVEGCYREDYTDGLCKRHREERDYRLAPRGPMPSWADTVPAVVGVLASDEQMPSHPDILV